MLPEDHHSAPEEEKIPETTEKAISQEGTDVPKRRRMRVKIRKKIRIKQKPSAKKVIRKVAERTFWVVIIVGFIVSLIIMIVQLDVRDEKFKQQQKKMTPAKTR
jgi:hypothetical protein